VIRVALVADLSARLRAWLRQFAAGGDVHPRKGKGTPPDAQRPGQGRLAYDAHAELLRGPDRARKLYQSQALPVLGTNFSAEVVRFDALADSRRLDPRGLNELRWETVYQRPDLQMRVIVLMTRDAYNRLVKLVPDHLPRLAMADAAYNGGIGGLLNERRACGLKSGCNPNVWFGNVEHTCLKSTKPLYGNRSACDINRHHVHDVLLTRMPKYQGKV